MTGDDIATVRGPLDAMSGVFKASAEAFLPINIARVCT
jgi:hypothetical protein